ncbi:DsrE family protein [Sulfoacidibacillus thermotolerans]|uniref:Uncharacterized protein n=1 Tax=Sulfoacidibacillus thermotolerans TaxID=1765684 RepID=A0A2U3DB32_SULT2|nr:DsrE family protein [Sulfoacidibacillus thermotolerans]PWI58483.1 hypothetical protein BM613_02875 [Sulfoacidibacillus thermotolerans]
MNQKFIIIVHASDTEGAKAAHALMYGKELHDAGIQVQMIFDGAGVKSLAGFITNTDRPTHKLYQQLKEAGVITGVCEYCTTAMGVADPVLQSGITALHAINGHPSIAEYIKQGFTPIIM